MFSKDLVTSKKKKKVSRGEKVSREAIFHDLIQIVFSDN